ncbi:MAG: NUDIX domain-containing protein [Acidobacteria bacterium]|nr:NUDIX domain-containing protein [Acidobacteriota bacterium]
MELSGKVWKLLTPGWRSRLARLLQPTFTASAAGIITNTKGEVLLLDHLLRPRSGWGIPGGFLKKGEQAHEAMIREVREECGIEVSDARLYRVRTLRRHIEIIFTATAEGEPKVASREITQAKWFSLEELPSEMSRGQHEVIHAALGR